MNSMLYNNLKVIDTDSHWSEPYDLWTSRAPAKWKDRVPQMEERDGKRRWWFDGNIPIGLPIASSVIGQDGTKVTGTAFFDMDNDVVHRASFDPDARVSMLDSLGIHAQIMYPNVAGFGNQNFLKSSDEALRLISVEIYNDALAEFQADTGERVLAWHCFLGGTLMPQLRKSNAPTQTGFAASLPALTLRRRAFQIWAPVIGTQFGQLAPS